MTGPTIVEALQDPELFGGLQAFRDISTWTRWLVFLKAVDRQPLTDDEQKIFCEHTGRTCYDPPEGGYPETAAIMGRQSGKTIIAATLVAFEAATYQSRVWAASNPEHVTNTSTTPLTAEEWVTPLRLGEPLEFIPFTFANPTGVTHEVRKPPLIDLADVSIAHFLNSADHEHGLYLTALPTPWFRGSRPPDSTPLAIGPSTAWDLGADGDAADP